MNDRKPWAEVLEHDIVEGSQGSLWAVDAIERVDERGRPLVPPRVWLTHIVTNEKRPGQPDPGKAVVVVVSAAEALETAIALTKVALGGQEIGTSYGPLPGQNEMEQWICPQDYSHPGAYMGHLLIHHGLTGGALSGLHLAALRHLHDEVHTPDRRGPAYVAHVHDPRYGAIEAERVGA